MNAFNIHEIDLDRLNSLTKYPSIPTYHQLGERGILTEEHLSFTGPVAGFEKLTGQIAG